ncbi:hypothetical protein PCCS19_36120 [Paenibacillus sp. CCS19]|uniref:AAA family ATPase n=1 Tax=Paenibacillus sp. CCS19 TaxID=3158387 RepID=UPI0025639786|nr:AAA family ATPase [Paenibacillus cellulosilyticus]GMK40556.1 hypothetical protein PCCS19_36120 [Paenibacillus cellulosilyticus]
MIFKVYSTDFEIPLTPVDVVYLIEDNWNDWWEYKTMYTLYYIDRAGVKHHIGSVKIGQEKMKEKRPDLPSSFQSLSNSFFSVGQDVDYYSNLNKLAGDTRHGILAALNDIALKPDVYERVRLNRVVRVSLLRDVRKVSIEGQYRRLANGDARLTRYEFTYRGPKVKGVNERLELSFDVKPKSNPPSNVHVVIGRNAVGKTHLLNNMIKSLIDNNANRASVGYFVSTQQENPEVEEIFANVVFVSFSAFDITEPVHEQKDKSMGIQFSYIGLKQVKKGLPPKSPDKLKKEFGKSLYACKSSSKITRWLRAVEMLNADPIFQEANISSILEDQPDEDTEVLYKDLVQSDDKGWISPEDKRLMQRAESFFHRLSSGHKIVLLTLTRLVETVEERTLVLLDEPEAHLHPPLLSAFTRALSDLLVSRNAVGIIATHSPVIVQEVPKSCVWKLRRSGLEVSASRSEIETFGENLGSLTREIFELEVTYSGFYKMLDKAVEDLDDYDEVVDHFNDELGMEARAIIRGLIASRDRGGE